MMSINRYNYEEYFLLYVDNELSAAERREVETFLAENPDLEEELVMFKKSQLKPDTSLVLQDKSTLFKAEQQTLINLENYETFFLLYVDEELSAEERRAVELFASAHPAQQQELAILMQTRLTPEASVVFPDKSSLYKKVGREKVVVMKVWRIVAVAAMLILAVGIWWLSPGKQKDAGIAQTKQETNQKVDQEVASKTSQPSNDHNGVEQGKGVEKQAPQIVGTTAEKVQEKRDYQPKHKNETQEMLYAEHKTIDATSDEELDIQARLIAKADMPEVMAKGSASVADNVIIVDQPMNQAAPNATVQLTKAETEPDEMVAVGPIQTKNRLRGLFRTVTRVVEKNTHVATGENKRLLIGNLEIALK